MRGRGGVIGRGRQTHASGTLVSCSKVNYGYGDNGEELLPPTVPPPASSPVKRAQVAHVQCMCAYVCVCVRMLG